MKTTFIIIGMFLLSSLLSAQFISPRFPINSTAEILPNISSGVHAFFSPYTPSRNQFNISAFIGISGKVQFELSNEGLTRDLFDDVERQLTWGCKVKILSENGEQPTVALNFRSALEWNWGRKEIEANGKSYLYHNTLSQISYENRFMSAGVIITQEFNKNILLNGGFGLHELQTRNVFFGRTATDTLYSLPMRSLRLDHHLLIYGFFSSLISVSSYIALIGEINAIPIIQPNADLSALEVDRIYVCSIGARSIYLKPLAIDATVVFMSNIAGHTTMEIRVGTVFFISQ